ncbi:hypothetical protein IV203_022785, partial [Nitzschia inconspicua]
MTDRQKQLRTAILQSRPRTGLNGPFGPWLAVPDIAEPASSLGKACRYDTSLSFRESEMIILLTGAKMKSHTEFEIHTHEAIQAGWSMDVISAIPRNDEFTIQAVETRLVPLLKNDRERSLYDSQPNYSTLVRYRMKRILPQKRQWTTRTVSWSRLPVSWDITPMFRTRSMYSHPTQLTSRWENVSTT